MSYVVAVSIHTLRTEAACSLRLHLQMIGHFNSRTHVWGRFLPQRHFYGDFDSRTRAGCDRVSLVVHIFIVVLIRVPAQGATSGVSGVSHTDRVLIRVPV